MFRRRNSSSFFRTHQVLHQVVHWIPGPARDQRQSCSGDNRRGVRLLVSTLVPKITINLHASSFKARLRALENTLGVMNGARYPTADEVKGGAAHSKSLSESVRRVTSTASS